VLAREGADTRAFYASSLRDEAPGADEPAWSDIHFLPRQRASLGLSLSAEF